MNSIEKQTVIKTFRQSNNLSCEHLAELLGTTARTVRRWEDGTRAVAQTAIKYIILYTVAERLLSALRLEANKIDKSIIKELELALNVNLER